MKKYNLFNKLNIRLIYWMSFIVIMIFVVCPIFFFFYLFNENNVKNLIISQFSNSRFHLEIKGKIIPQFWHGLSLKVFDLQVVTNDNVRLMNISTLNCQMSWIGLIGANYQIKRISLNNVHFYENNILNSKILSILDAKDNSFKFLSQLTNIQIDGLSSIDENVPYIIKNGVIKFDRSFRTNKLVFRFELPKDKLILNGSGSINDIKNNIIYLNSYNIKLLFHDLKISFNTNMMFDLTNRSINFYRIFGKFLAKNYYGDINSNNFKFNSNLFSSDKLTLILKKINSKDKVDVEVNELLINSKIQVSVKKANLKYLYIDKDNYFNGLTQLKNIKFDEAGILTSQCNINTVYGNNQLQMNLNDLKTTLSGLCVFNVDSKIFNLNLQGRLNNHPLVLDILINDSGIKPYVEIKAKANSIKTTEVSNGKFKPLYYNNNTLPFAWLSYLDMKGDILIDNIIINKIYLNKFDVHFNLKDNILNITKLGANIYGGKLTGEAQIIKTNNLYTITTKQKIYNLNLQGIFKDLFDVEAISGTANMELTANVANVKTIQDIHKKFNGNIIINATHGAFQGVNLNLFSISKINENYKKSTIFDQLNATLNFVNGVSRNEMIMFRSQYVIANGIGSIDFVLNTINYLFTIKSALPPNQQEFKSVIIPVTVKGDMFNPTINIKNIHLSKVHEIIHNSILGNIGKNLLNKFKKE